MSEWTEERIDSLRFMWSEGLSASEIATRLGGLTRNAVIGKVHRLKLHNRVGVAKEIQANTPQVKVAEVPKVAMAASIAKVVVRPAPRIASTAAPRLELPEMMGSVLKPVPLLKTLVDLNKDDCRWPVNGERAETRFCCHAVSQGSSYCEYHRLAAKGSGTVSERLAARELRRAA
ncbi:GcrA cell cycle regulator [Rhizobiaceae bacterium CRRU44]|uniref:GcrA cell cycle regulator n=1 Tax=Ferranicluibacter rubi TaxID=2715133 RepID=A0AA43ZFK4_9HYPH|nr:GcrA family cell cycle regulator [Ferranicluibacter rubi]NHT75907.1 GcrA cell cycle regulator [Ferranicluibacter rubi]NHT75967.1 GcrA cell cycle regulator [Ferranicluibacter rubi]